VTPGAVVAIIALLAQVYSVDAGLLNCIVAHESDYRTDAVNGIHEGLCQYNPETLTWMAGMAADDDTFLHGYMTPDANEPVYALSLMAWAIRNGMGAHWSTWRLCGGE
jgi:hypothetical protein